MKTVYFIGAGSTASLGLPTTFKQCEKFKQLFFDRDAKIVKEFDVEGNDEFAELCELVTFRFRKKENFNILAFLDFINSLRHDNRGYIGGDKCFDPIKIEKCYNTYVYLLRKLFCSSEKDAFKNKAHEIEHLVKFYKSLAEQALDAKMKEISKVNNLSSKEFIETNYSIINTNWDIFSILPLMHAHKLLNDDNSRYSHKDNNIYKLKIFNDFGIYLDCYKQNAECDKLWYPYNLPAAMRVNDVDYKATRRICLVNTYFPHGLDNMFLCPYCKKQTLIINKDFALDDSFVYDMNDVKCLHCGGEIKAHDVSIILQTRLKTKPVHLAMIQQSMRVEISKATQINFIGYSLPLDDTEYGDFLARSNPTKVKVLLFEENMPNEWISNDEMFHGLSDENLNTVNRYRNLFSNTDLQFNFCGFGSNNNVDFS